ncbi:uncharacterized protein ACR2FA_010088 [Aphomia sociella]
MNKLTIVFVLAAFVCIIKAEPISFPQFPQLAFAAFPQFPTFAPITFPTFKPITAEDIKNLKPADGGVVSGASISSSSTIETVDGKPVRKESTHILTNDNGNVKEVNYDN